MTLDGGINHLCLPIALNNSEILEKTLIILLMGTLLVKLSTVVVSKSRNDGGRLATEVRGKLSVVFVSVLTHSHTNTPGETGWIDRGR